jgi:hypothetical protein
MLQGSYRTCAIIAKTLSKLVHQCVDLRVLGEAPGLLFREDGLTVDEYFELALAAGLDLGLVLGLGVQLGRETRGPFVVAVSDGAVEDANLRHGENLSRQIVLNCSKGWRQLSQ